jgi:hypothetical protein
MTDGFARAAVRLAELAPEDRGWLLGQLSPAQRERLSSLVERVLARGESAPGEPAGEPTSPRAPLGPEEVVARAGAAQVALALDGEPEWIVALLLARRTWNWSRDYLDRLDAREVERLRAATRRVDAAASPQVFEAAVAALARKLERVAPELVERTAFDSVVARLTGTARHPAERSRPWR